MATELGRRGGGLGVGLRHDAVTDPMTRVGQGPNVVQNAVL